MRDVLKALAATNGVDVAIQRVVDLARECLRMDLACVSRLRGDSLVVETTSGELPGTPIVTGLSFDVRDSYDAATLAYRHAVVPDTRADRRTRDLPATAALGIRSHLGVALRSGDALYGTLCLVSVSPRQELQQWDLHILTRLAKLVEEVIDYRSRVLAAHGDRTARIRRILDHGGPTMAYQPIHAIPHRRVAGYEALSRFPPDLPGPAAWFTAAADVGLGVELELAAVRRAMNDLDALPPPCWLAVNLSPHRAGQS